MIAIIPARYDSTRFPGKPLAEIDGKTMIQHVYERTSKACSKVFVATDDQRIFNEVMSFKGEAVMTPECENGTQRCAVACSILREQGKMHREFDELIVNVQGDMPFVEPRHILSTARTFAEDYGLAVATPVVKIDRACVTNPHVVKVVKNNKGFAMYFSRSDIPYYTPSYYKHIGIYVYKAYSLTILARLKPTKCDLASAERLEQLRWMEHGYTIKCVEVHGDVMAVDTPEDLKKL